MVKRLFGRVVIGGVALLAAGCAQEDGPLSPGSIVSDEVAQVALDCHIDVKGLSMSCEPQETAVVGGASAALFGNQGEFVELLATNVKQVGQIFSADVMVKNLINQTLGTTDGKTKDPDAVRVFFSFEPISTDGSLSTETSAPPVEPGTVTHVASATDGTATFLEPGQVYYKYDQMIAPGRTSLARNWQWELSSEVRHFYFTVYVSAKLAREDDVVGGVRMDVRSTSASNRHSCALTTTNEVYCWGNDSNGQMGIGGSAADSVDPGTPIILNKDILTITGGREHTCGIAADSTAYCWGYNGQGQVGSGNPNSNIRVPEQVGNGIKFISIASGSNHICGIQADGTAVCWGHNNNGQMGVGAFDNQQYRTPVAVQFGEPFLTTGSGHNFVCASTATDTTTYCWGEGIHGAIGNGTTGNGNRFATPQQALTPPGVKLVQLAGGRHHICGLTSDGTAYCWGMNNNGQLGVGNTDDQTTPQKVQTDLKFIMIDAGSGSDYEGGRGYHTCGIAVDGKAYCWGENQYGQLGIGGTAGVILPTEVAAGNRRFISIATGARHTCATTVDGEAYCWGSGAFRQLGIPATSLDAPGDRVENVNYFASVELFQSDEPSFVPAWTTFEAYAFGGRLAPVVGEG